MDTICDYIYTKYHIPNPNRSLHHYAMFVPSKQIVGVRNLSYGVNQNISFRSIPSTHAEMEAMKRIERWKRCPKKVDLIVLRYTKNGVLGDSRPCYHCIAFLESSRININWVYYSNKQGSITKIKFSHLAFNKENTAHISSGMKYKLYGDKYKESSDKMKDFFYN